jgi:hypothetical protein
MANDEIRKLEQLDLSKISLADLKDVKNPVMRNALLQMIGAVDIAVTRPEHTSHGSHTSHLKSQLTLIDFEVNPQRGGGR